MKNKTINDLFVLNFVQKVSSPQSHAKRLSYLRKMMRNCPNDLTMIQWMQLWRGFYYIVWYEEMQKGGEELIMEMGSYENSSFLMSGFKALAEAWNSIDAFRIDKYMFLIRIMLRNCLQKQIEALRNEQNFFENEIFIENYRNDDQKNPLTLKANVIDYIISVTSQSVGLFLHICDIYLDELKSTINSMITENDRPQIYHELLLPFVKWYTLIRDDRLLKSIENNIFINLINETLLDESFENKKIILKNTYDSLLNVDNTSSKNRIEILDQIKRKMDDLDGKTRNKIKRKVIGFCRKTKRPKYETVANTPFVRSIVPLPII